VYGYPDKGDNDDEIIIIIIIIIIIMHSHLFCSPGHILGYRPKNQFSSIFYNFFASMVIYCKCKSMTVFAKAKVL